MIPTLIVMAAGMGSRYGGPKQVEKMTDTGEIILDFSLYDAMMAGFEKAIFVIRREHRDLFRTLVDERAGRYVEVEYAYQDIEDIPCSRSVCEDRKKPWGTAHAVFACRHIVKGPFAVINADDYYGFEGFMKMYEFLCERNTGSRYPFAMVGYMLRNTVTDNGHVARGICSIDERGSLTKITERTCIERRGENICFSEDRGKTWKALEEDTVVSMNFWGFSDDMMGELETGMRDFVETCSGSDFLTAEYQLPAVVDRLISEGKAEVKVLTTEDKWCGVTYREDKEDVKDTLQSMKNKGIYPVKFWD